MDPQQGRGGSVNYALCSQGSKLQTYVTELMRTSDFFCPLSTIHCLCLACKVNDEHGLFVTCRMQRQAGDPNTVTLRCTHTIGKLPDCRTSTVRMSEPNGKLKAFGWRIPSLGKRGIRNARVTRREAAALSTILSVYPSHFWIGSLFGHEVACPVSGHDSSTTRGPRF